MKLANRVARLGIETAFAVSAEAAAHAARGNKVYPFHLGDINLPTPQNVQEAAVLASRPLCLRVHKAEVIPCGRGRASTSTAASTALQPFHDPDACVGWKGRG